MKHKGRPPKLNEVRKQFCLLVSAGFSNRKAATFSGVTHWAVGLAVRTDPQFAAEVRDAKMRRELLHLNNIRTAGQKSWRASAWYLERIDPDEYQARAPDTVTAADVKATFQGMGELIAEEVPEEQQLSILQKLKWLMTGRKPKRASVGDAFTATHQPAPPIAPESSTFSPKTPNAYGEKIDPSTGGTTDLRPSES